MATINSTPNKIIIAVTGASGSVYAQKLIDELCKSSVERIYIVVSNAGLQVLDYELKRSEASLFSLNDVIFNKNNRSKYPKIKVFENDDFFSPIASGSSAADAMVVLPCSMGTLARIATGTSQDLISRSADVCLKDRKKLIICPRESPLNRIHLQNMLAINDAGGQIIPPNPAFYQRPKTLDDIVNFVVGKVLESLGFKHSLYKPWAERLR